MADVREIEAMIEKLRLQIAPVVREIEALEALAAGLRKIEKGEPLTRPEGGDLSDLTMPEAAAQILLEHEGESLHYLKVTEIALARGFTGKRIKPGAQLEQIASSFRRMMAQDKKTFQQLVRGRFAITEEFARTHE